MSTWRFLVTYEGTIEAADEYEAKAWAEEEVANGIWQISTVEVERVKVNADIQDHR